MSGSSSPAGRPQDAKASSSEMGALFRLCLFPVYLLLMYLTADNVWAIAAALWQGFAQEGGGADYGFLIAFLLFPPMGCGSFALLLSAGYFVYFLYAQKRLISLEIICSVLAGLFLAFVSSVEAAERAM